MLECGRERFLVFAHHKLVLDHITTELVKKVRKTFWEGIKIFDINYSVNCPVLFSYLKMSVFTLSESSKPDKQD